jgi:hypothetical protein
MHPLTKFLALPRNEKMLFLEASILLIISQLSVKAIKFKHIYGFLRRYSVEKPCNGDRAAEIKVINQSLLRAARRLPLNTLCLSRSIATFIMLRRRCIPAIIYAGVKSEDSSLLAHAWVWAGTGVIGADPGNEAFNVVMRIGHEPRNH